MIVNLKRCLSILLAVMLLIGIIPAAYAVELGVDSTQREEINSEGTDCIDPTEPTEPTEPPDIPDTQDDYAVMSVGSTQKSILLFDYADNGNYTTVLKSQVMFLDIRAHYYENEGRKGIRMAKVCVLNNFSIISLL